MLFSCFLYVVTRGAGPAIPYNESVRLLAILTAVLPLAAAGIAVQDVTVIDVAAGIARPHMTVVIDQGKISRVGAASSIQIQPNTRIVAGKDKFLIPGLWDMDVHLYFKEYLPLFVAFGVTGVQDTGSDYSKVKIWRDEIEKDSSSGPRILTSGPSVDGIASKDLKTPMLVARNADQGRDAFDQLADMNVDFVGWRHCRFCRVRRISRLPNWRATGISGLSAPSLRTSPRRRPWRRGRRASKTCPASSNPSPRMNRP